MTLAPVSIYGKGTRLYIGDGAETEEFSICAGETSLDWKAQSDDVDLSSKDDGQLKAGSYGQQAITFTMQGNVKLPDTGLERASTIANTSPPETNIQVKRDGVIIYQGRAGIGNFSCSFPKDGSATYSFDMKAVAVPTVNDLGASS